MGLLKNLQQANQADAALEAPEDDEDFVPIPENAAASVAAPSGDEKKPVDANSPVNDVIDLPAEVAKLETMLRGFDWWYSYSDDSSVRGAGSDQERAIRAQADICKQTGHLEAAEAVWKKYAPEFTPPLSRLLNSGSVVTLDPAKETQPDVAASQTNQTEQTSRAGVGQSDLLTKILTAPFAITAAAGSLVVHGLRSLGDKAKGYYTKGMENGYAIQERQLDAASNGIVSLTDSLRKSGMESLITDMKATGRPMHEIFQGMEPGGPYQHFSNRFSGLLKDKAFAAQYARLEDALKHFGFLAHDLAQTGVELGRDATETIDRNLETVSQATEGFSFKKNGMVKHLQELVQTISESIRTLIANLTRRLRPQP